MTLTVAGPLALALCCAAAAQNGANVLLVINNADTLSRRIGEYYTARRSIPPANVCRIHTDAIEEIQWTTFVDQIEKPIAACLQSKKLVESVLYIVTTGGVPLKISGMCGSSSAECASVDSELTLLYDKLRGAKFGRAGYVRNPFFTKRDVPFRHPLFPIYLVTRLAAYDFEDVKKMIDRSLAARNRGKFVIDLKSDDDEPGNDWLRNAAVLLPTDRVVFDDSTKVLYGQKNVIGYASWGSNDKNRNRRTPGFEWLPGGIATEFVSTDGRTFQKPPANWNITTWNDKTHYFANSPQSLTADLINEGATGASGHVYEPYLFFTPRPDQVLPSYYNGHNLAESFYVGLPALSWMNIIIGDPLCSLGKP